VRRASPSELPGLQASVHTMAESMGLSREVAIWWGRFSTSPFPAVVEGRRAVHLVIPDGMATLPHDVAGAMIAHELGHVAQDDICLWSRAKASGSPIYRAALICMAGSLILALVAQAFLLAAAKLALLHALRRQRRLVSEARHESELMADMAAAAFGPGVDALLRALALSRSGGPNDAQLAPGARMAQARRFGVAAPPATPPAGLTVFRLQDIS
jgi:hypothetical protein